MNLAGRLTEETQAILNAALRAALVSGSDRIKPEHLAEALEKRP